MEYNTKPFQCFSLSQLSDRFICGGSALTVSRGVSRKRLSLVEIIPDYPDFEAQQLVKDIQAYRNAKIVFYSADKMTSDILLKAHKEFYSNKLEMGEFRTTQNWIGQSFEKAVYIPPPPDELEQRLQEWYDLVNVTASSVEDAIKLHIKLLEIHPFYDANGRISRAFLESLISKIDKKMLPLSVYRFGVSPAFSRSGEQAFGVSSNEGVQHAFWQESIEWTKKTTLLANTFISEINSRIKSKLGIFSITKQELEVIEYLWVHPIITPKKLHEVFAWDMEFCHLLLMKLCNLGMLTTKKLRDGNGKVVFVCEDIFKCFETIDALLLSEKNKIS